MSAACDIGLCGKVSMGLYDEISENRYSFGAEPRRTGDRENFAVLDAFDRGS
jgi:hypothetical protein